MDIRRIKQLHQQILDLYQSSLLPIVDKYFDHEENLAQAKPGGEYSDTLVTQADLAINAVLSEKLPQLLPGSSVISEENTNHTILKHTFVIDPIDGTHTFARNLDEWGISLTLVEDAQVLYSLVIFPNCKTRFYYAIKDSGTFDSGEQKISPKPFFKFKPTITSAPLSRKVGRALFNFTEGKMLSIKTHGSAVHAMYTLLRGGTDFLIYDHLHVWDVLGPAFMARQAGLVIKWLGDEPTLDNRTDITQSEYTLALYKPDFDNNLLKDIFSVIQP